MLFVFVCVCFKCRALHLCQKSVDCTFISTLLLLCVCVLI